MLDWYRENYNYIVYELYTFDNLFRLLLKSDFVHEEALDFILANCSLSAYVFQERIHNEGYTKLSAKDALHPALAANSAPAIKVPLPIQVHIRVNTILVIGMERLATIMSSLLLTCLDFQKFMMVSPAR